MVKEMEVKAIQKKVGSDKEKSKQILANSKKSLADERKQHASSVKVEQERLEVLVQETR